MPVILTRCCFKWPLRLPDLTHHVFSMGLYESIVYTPSLPISLEELKQKVTEVLENVTQDMLQRVWQE